MDQMDQPIFGFDCDGVLTDLYCNDLMARHRNLPAATRDTLSDWHVSRFYGMTDAEDDAWWDRHAEEAYAGDRMPEGALDVLHWLSKRARIFVITARPESVRELTRDWLDRTAVPYHQLIVGADDKAAAARQYGISAFMEDSPYNAIRLAGAGVPTILRDWGYNRDVRHPLIQRVHHWTEVRPILSDYLPAAREATA